LDSGLLKRKAVKLRSQAARKCVLICVKPDVGSGAPV